MQYEIDPVVEEIREIRKKIFARCKNDPHTYGKFLLTIAAKRKALLVKKKKQI